MLVNKQINLNIMNNDIKLVLKDLVAEALKYRKNFIESCMENTNKNIENISLVIEKNKKESEILENIERQIDGDIFSFSNIEEIEIIAGFLHSYLMELEADAEDLIKDESFTEEDKNSFISSYKETAEIIINTQLDKYKSNLKPDLDKFIKRLEFLSDKNNSELIINTVELQTLSDIFKHISDHENWMYDSFNGDAISSINAKINQKVEDLENESTKGYKGFIENYIYEGLNRDVETALKCVKSGTMISFNYLNELNKIYSYLKDGHARKIDIEEMLEEISSINSELFKSSHLVVYGVDPEDEI